MIRKLSILLTALAIISCKKESSTPPLKNPGFKEFIIPKGEHYANGSEYRELHINAISFTAIFDSSCIYSTSKVSNSGDVNKLYGFSDGNTPHHENSARFGWLWNGQALEVYAYCYSNSKREIKLLGTVPIGKEIDMSINIHPSEYVFFLNGKSEIMQRNITSDVANGYQLYPYFGGDEVAPHEIKILIRDNKPTR
ncbi:MAG TPA: hypothetical protein VJT83_00670 [Chitinophagaceae bacterium]|nr:hypothetical protein [Chitinophagaceae bacterium]